MSGVEAFTAQQRLGAAPGLINAAHAFLPLHQGLKRRGIARNGIGAELFHHACQGIGKHGAARLSRGFQQRRSGDGRAKSGEHFRLAFAPERIIQRERHKHRIGGDFRQADHTRRNRHGPFTRVTETPRRIDPKDMRGIGQHLFHHA